MNSFSLLDYQSLFTYQIEKKSDNRYALTYVKGFYLDGRPMFATCSAESEQAVIKKFEQKIEKYGREIFAQTGLSKEGWVTVESYCWKWYEQVQRKVKESTQVKYEQILRNHIIPLLGNLMPLTLTTSIIESFTNELENKNLAPKTINDILGVLKQVLDQAARDFPRYFPILKIEKVKEVKKEKRALDKKEQSSLFNYLQTDEDPAKFGTLLAAYTGLRLGEICALKWEDINPIEGFIEVNKTMSRIRNLSNPLNSKTKVVITEPKTENANRMIPLTEKALTLCRKFDPHNPGAFVLTGTESFIEPRQLERIFASYCRKCEIDGFTFHGLRHNFATKCHEAEIDNKMLSDFLGHGSVSMTFDHYVHPSREEQRACIEKLVKVGF